MNVAIIYTHPYENSYCFAILKLCAKGLYKGGH